MEETQIRQGLLQLLGSEPLTGSKEFPKIILKNAREEKKLYNMEPNCLNLFTSSQNDA